MNKCNLYSLRIPAFLLAVSVMVAACAGTSKKNVEDVVRERATERWDLVLAGKFDEAYEYYSPGYRSSVSMVDYIVEMRLRKVKWTKAEFQEIECAEASCKIEWKVWYEVFRPVPGLEKWTHFSNMEDAWIQTDGKWWYLPDTQ